MQLNGVKFVSLEFQEREQLESIKYKRPYGKGRNILDYFGDPIYLIHSNKYKTMHNDLKIQRNLLKYFIYKLEREKKISIERREYLKEKIEKYKTKVKKLEKEKREYEMKYHINTRVKLTRRIILERIVYIEQLKYRVEKDRDNDDDELKALISFKLDELIEELKEDYEEL
jgi:hypothetical protein